MVLITIIITIRCSRPRHWRSNHTLTLIASYHKGADQIKTVIISLSLLECSRKLHTGRGTFKGYLNIDMHKL